MTNTNNEKVTPSDKALEAIAKIEERLVAAHRADIESRGVKHTKPVSYGPKEYTEAEQSLLDERAKPTVFSIAGKESFTGYNKGNEKVTGPSRLGDGNGGVFITPGTGSVRGPSPESIAKAEEQAREQARVELERIKKEEAAKAAFTPDAVQAQLQFLTRKVQKLEKQLKEAVHTIATS